MKNFPDLVFGVLEWRTLSGLDDLLEHQVAAVRSRLERQLPTLPAKTLDLMSGLPDSSWRRMITAPEFCRNIFADTVDAALLNEHLLGELAAAGSTSAVAAIVRVSTPASTALGDITWINEADGPAVIDAPVCRGVVVDGMSKHARAHRSGFPEPMRLHSADELHRISAELSVALAAIRSTSRATGDLVEAVTRVLLLRKSDALSTASCSWPKLPGCVGLVNPLREPTPWWINSLVHESIHCLLYLTESRLRWYSRVEAMTAQQVTSPWTNRKLHLHSFVHACLVWYGLLNYWCRDGTEVAAEYARAAAFGFRDPDRLIETVRNADGLHTAVTDLVTTVCAAGGHRAIDHL